MRQPRSYQCPKQMIVPGAHLTRWTTVSGRSITSHYQDDLKPRPCLGSNVVVLLVVGGRIYITELPWWMSCSCFTLIGDSCDFCGFDLMPLFLTVPHDFSWLFRVVFPIGGSHDIISHQLSTLYRGQCPLTIIYHPVKMGVTPCSSPISFVGYHRALPPSHGARKFPSRTQRCCMGVIGRFRSGSCGLHFFRNMFDHTT